jgi:cytochrome c oxidase subunit 2
VNPDQPFTLSPESASTHAATVDSVFGFIIGVSVFFASLTAILLIYYAIRYRRRSEDYYPKAMHGSNKLEWAWTIGLLVLFMIMFFWATSAYFSMIRPPDDAEEIFVTGKQWMWKVQHVGGQREINALHVPVGKPVRLVMTSEDVIHDFFIPDFRVKQDVLPNRYSWMWFQATKPGTYRLYCAEYCGTLHSRMIGWVTAMEPDKYADWLHSGADLGMALRGRQLFLKYQCIACHAGENTGRAPSLEGIYEKRVPIQDDDPVEANERYLRESIRFPLAKLHAGYRPIMPQFGPEQMSDDDLQDLVAFIKSLKRGGTPTRNERTRAPESGTEPGALKR